MPNRKKTNIIALIVFCLSTVLFISFYLSKQDLQARADIYFDYYLEKAALSIAEDTPQEAWSNWVVFYVDRYNAAHPAAESEENETPEILEQYADLYAQNPDLIGWLKIPGTNIDYPVMQTKADPEYYLHRGFDGNYLYEGTLFLDAGSDILLPSANFLIYGHNMKNNTQFGQLPDYLDESFYTAHPVIQFDTIYETGSYEVIAVFLSQIYSPSDDVFKYYQWGLIDTEEEFDAYVQNAQALAVYDTGQTAAWGDQLLTLSTCYYHTTEGRCVVVARKLEAAPAYQGQAVL